MLPKAWYLLGFDVRQADRAPLPPAIGARLLGGDVRRVQSVDRALWPAIPAAFTRELAQTGSMLGLMGRLDRLAGALDSADRLPACWIVAIAIYTFDWATDETAALVEARGAIDPPDAQSGWTHLGFDVADRYLTSGLVRGEGQPPFDAEWVRRFARHLNRGHLFEQLEPALELAAVLNAAMSAAGDEPTAHYVYSLWRVKAYGEG